VVLNGGNIAPLPVCREMSPRGGEMSPRGSELVLGGRGAASAKTLKIT